MKRQKSNDIKKTEPILYHIPIKFWPADERPRERLLKRGASALTDVELLAILIRIGKKGITAVDLARNLITRIGSLSELSKMSVHDMRRLGIGENQAITILAALELSKRLRASRSKDKIIIRSPEDIVKNFAMQFKGLLQEEFWIFPLNSTNRLLEPKQISRGILNSSLVHPRECFREAISQSAAAVIFLHNHPSGNPEPSAEDLAITRQLIDAGKIIGISVHDHIIIAGDNYISFAERNLM